MLHHVELWVPDLGRAVVSFGWLLGAMGYTLCQEWGNGRSWRLGSIYLVHGAEQWFGVRSAGSPPG